MASQVHSFSRWFDATTIAGNAAYVPYLGSAYFALSQLPNAAEFAALYDQFKLTHVKMYVHLKRDPGAQSGAASTYPKFYLLRDYTDATAPASLNELRESGKTQCKVLTPNKRVTFNIKPAVSISGYRTAVANMYMPAWKRWIDTQYTDTPHYGIKIGIDDLTNTNYVVSIEYKYWFQCRNTK